jgi:hypothetical protein
MYTYLRKALLVLAIALAPSLAFAQGAILQGGAVTNFDIGGFRQDKVLESASTIFGNDGRGFNSFHIFAPNTCGLYIDNKNTSDPTYINSEFCFGYTSLGVPMFQFGGIQYPLSNLAQTGGTVNTCILPNAIAVYNAAGNSIVCLSSLGTSGQVLTSNGAGQLPTWQPAAGGGGPTAGTYMANTSTSTTLAPIATGSLLAISKDGATAFGDSPIARYVSQTGTCASHSQYADGVQCINTTAGDGNSWKLAEPAGWDARWWGVTYPLNFYVSTSGNDQSGNNTCLVVGSPCLTLNQLNIATRRMNLNGQNLTWNLGAGTFNLGVTVDGTVTRGSQLLIKGAGSGSTTINDTETSQCTAIEVAAGGNVAVQGMLLETTCALGSDFWVAQYGRGQLVSDLLLGPAPTTRIFAQDHSFIEGDAGCCTISGGSSTYGILATDVSDIRWFGGVINITGSPTITTFISAANNSHIKVGGVTYSGSFSGQSYALSQLSSIDTEGIYPIPGAVQGAVSGNSIFPGGTDVGPCIGGLGGCAVTNPPTGVGAGAAYGLASVSDYGGKLSFTAGTGVSTPIVIFIHPYSQMALCMAELGIGGTGAWDPRATVKTVAGSFAGGNGFEMFIDNNGVAPNPGSIYIINWLCH